MKLVKKLLALFIISLCIVGVNHVYEDVSAESYEGSVGISFTLNPTINVTVSGDLTIANLTPGDYKDSNNITVTASSNSIAGYTLSSTVGSSTNTSTELRKDGVDTTNKFSSITTNKASLSAFDDSTNTWGYSYSTDSGTTWQSGDITGTPLTGYNGLPLYTSSSSIKLINSTTSGTSSVLFKIGARTTTNQIAGEYTNVINFIGIANPNPQVKTLDQVTTMQEPFSCTLTREGTTNTLTDTRDGNSYAVKKINGLCWMTQNLRITGTIDANKSNFTGDDFNVSKYDLTNTAYCNTGTPDNPKGYDNVCSHNSGNTTIGVWYNYAAATAGQITGYDNSTIATQDICPSNWHIPSGPSTTNETNYNELVGNTTYGWQIPTPSLIAFNAISGGGYDNGSIQLVEDGFWWSNSYDTAQRRYRLVYDSNTNKFTGSDSGFRSRGLFIRCVHSS